MKKVIQTPLVANYSLGKKVKLYLYNDDSHEGVIEYFENSKIPSRNFVILRKHDDSREFIHIDSITKAEYGTMV